MWTDFPKQVPFASNNTEPMEDIYQAFRLVDVRFSAGEDAGRLGEGGPARWMDEMRPRANARLTKLRMHRRKQNTHLIEDCRIDDPFCPWHCLFRSSSSSSLLQDVLHLNGWSGD